MPRPPPPDQPSPTKRQRRESTPRQPRADSSSATPDDLSVERHASAKRLHDVWDQLAEKYSRRIDEDDLVDLVTGEIVKDRGVLSAETPWKFGRFADESVDDSTATDEEEEDDDDIDPLDLLAEPPQVSIRNWIVPPVRIVDPADAQDLEDFMDAERRRRENGGEEEVSELEEEPDEADASFDDESDATDPLPAPPSRTVEIDDSDDELDSWGFVDESNVVSPVKSEAIEILDSPSASPTRSSPRFKAPLPKMTLEQRPWPQLQLQTPPRSQTPSVLGEFATPVPTRPKPSPPKKLPTPKRVEEPMARSRSRGRSPLEPLPRLDLANIKRGRSTTRRTTRPVTEHDLGTPKASTSRAVEHISGKRDQPSSGKRSVAKAKQELSPEPYSALQSPAPQSTRKRKRKSLSVEDADPEPLVASSSSPSKGKQRASSVSTRIKSERPADISDVKPEFETPPASSHPYSHPGMPPYYAPPSFYPYPMYPPPPDVHPPMPLQDPRAQFIISQAMHQLSSLFTAPWPTQPFTPPSPSSSTVRSTSVPSPYYSYPTTPHRPHTHPYVFDSGASVDTLPPSSPPDSSPPLPSPHRPSLVSRSRSRGRQVSFKLDDRLSDGDGEDAQKDAIDARGRSRHRPEAEEPDDGSPSVKRKDKGKQRMVADAETPEPTPRPRFVITDRAQTPGPPLASNGARGDPAKRRTTTAKPRRKQ